MSADARASTVLIFHHAIRTLGRNKDLYLIFLFLALLYNLSKLHVRMQDQRVNIPRTIQSQHLKLILANCQHIKYNARIKLLFTSRDSSRCIIQQQKLVLELSQETQTRFMNGMVFIYYYMESHSHPKFEP